MSLPDRVMLLTTSSVTVTLWAVGVGRSLTGVMLMLTVAVPIEFAVPSFTRKVNESLPLKLPLGV